MLSDNNLRSIKKHLNRANSAIFVIGQGIDPKNDLFYTNFEVKYLYHSDLSIVKESWKKLFKKHPTALELPFINGFTNYVEKTSPIKLAKFYVVNQSISTNITGHKSNTEILNVNGKLHSAIDARTGILENVSSIEDIITMSPTFIPIDSNYKGFGKAIPRLEQFIEHLAARIIFFIGTSGECSIAESLYNRSLVRTLSQDPIFKVIVNPKETYMDGEADLVIRSDGYDFLKDLEAGYPEAAEFFTK